MAGCLGSGNAEWIVAIAADRRYPERRSQPPFRRVQNIAIAGYRWKGLWRDGPIGFGFIIPERVAGGVVISLAIRVRIGSPRGTACREPGAYQGIRITVIVPIKGTLSISRSNSRSPT